MKNNMSIFFAPAILSLIALLCWGIPALALDEPGENSDIENSEGEVLDQGKVQAEVKKKKKKKKKKVLAAESKDTGQKAAEPPIDWRLKALLEKVNVEKIANDWCNDPINGEQIAYIAQTMIETAQELLKLQDDQMVEFELYRSNAHYSFEQITRLEQRLVTRQHWFSYQHATVRRFLPNQLAQVSDMIRAIKPTSPLERKIKAARIVVLTNFKFAAHTLEGLANDVKEKISPVRKHFTQAKYVNLEKQVQIEMNEELHGDEGPTLTYDQKFRAAALSEILDQNNLLREKQEREARATRKQLEEQKEIEKKLRQAEIARKVLEARKQKALEALAIAQKTLAGQEASRQKDRDKEELLKNEGLKEKQKLRDLRNKEACDLLSMIDKENTAREAGLSLPSTAAIPYDSEALLGPQTWVVEHTPEYDAELLKLSDADKLAIKEVVELLGQQGPSLRLPHATPVKNSKVINELRPGHLAHTTRRPLYAWVDGRALLLTIAPEAKREPILFETRVKQAEDILAKSR